jgi:hypothetical protein
MKKTAIGTYGEDVLDRKNTYKKAIMALYIAKYLFLTFLLIEKIHTK